MDGSSDKDGWPIKDRKNYFYWLKKMTNALAEESIYSEIIDEKVFISQFASKHNIGTDFAEMIINVKKEIENEVSVFLPKEERDIKIISIIEKFIRKNYR